MRFFLAVYIFLIPDPFFTYRETSETFAIVCRYLFKISWTSKLFWCFVKSLSVLAFFLLKAPISLEMASLLAFTLFLRKVSFPLSNFNSSFGSIKPASLMNFSSFSSNACLVQQSKVVVLQPLEKAVLVAMLKHLCLIQPNL